MVAKRSTEALRAGHMRSFGLALPVTDQVTQQVVADPDDDFEIDPTEVVHIEEQLAEALLEIQRLEQEVASLAESVKGLSDAALGRTEYSR